MLLKRTLHNPIKIAGVRIMPGIQTINEKQTVRLPRGKNTSKAGPVKGPLDKHPSWINMIENGVHEEVKAPAAGGIKVTGNPGNMGEVDAIKIIKEIVSIPALEKQLTQEEKKQNKRPKVIIALKEQITVLDATIKEEEEEEED